LLDQGTTNGRSTSTDGVYLLDTNVLSEVVRRSPAPNVLRWFRDVSEDSLFLSVLSLGEIRKRVERVENGDRRKRLTHWLVDELPARFGSRIIAIDRTIAERWGRLSADQRAQPLPVIDALLAATALAYDLTVVTRNTRDIARSGASFLDPW